MEVSSLTGGKLLWRYAGTGADFPARGCTMSAASRVVYLRIALVIIGLLCIFGFYPLTIVWPSGWAWGRATPTT